MIRCQLDLKDYFPHISSDFCQFEVEGIQELVPKLRSKIKSLHESLILKQEEIQVQLEFIEVLSIPKVDSENLIRFVRGQEGILCRFHLSATLLAQETLMHLQDLVDQAFLAALNAHLKPGRKQTQFALSDLFGLERPRPSLTKVLDQGEVELRPYSPSELKLSLPRLRSFNLLRLPHGLLLDYDNFNHPEFYTCKDILKLLPKAMINLIGYHLGKDGLKRVCQNLQMIGLEHLSELIEIFFSEAQQLQLFLLALPSGQSYLEAWLSWPPELQVCFLAWVRGAQKPLDFFQAIARMEVFWQEIKVFCPKPESPKTRFWSFDFFAHLDSLSQLLNLIDEPYRSIQVNLIFELNSRPLQVYQQRMTETGAKWFCESMFSQAHLSRQILTEVLALPSAASFFQYASQYTLDYSSQFYQLFAYANYIEHLAPREQSFAWSFAAWVSASFELMSIQDFVRFYHKLNNLEDGLLNLLFSIPALNRPNSLQLLELCALAQEDSRVLMQVFSFYVSWHIKMTRAYIDAWPSLFKLMRACPPSQLAAVFAQAWDQDFSGVYAQTLGLIFALSPEDLDHIMSLFRSLDTGQQVEFLAILVSIELPWQPLSASQLNLVLQDVIAKKASFYEGFHAHLSGIHFHYFATMVDYDLVLARMTQLLNTVKMSLDFFLGDKRFMRFVPTVKTMMKKEAIAELERQQHHLLLVETELKSLRGLRHNLDLRYLFDLFKQFDSFFVSFVELPLEKIFEPLLFTLLGQLDASLKKSNRLKQLMTMVLMQHDKIAKTSLGQHLKPEMLKILVAETDIPLMQRFLQKFLVDDLMEALALELELKLQGTQLPMNLRRGLSSFLHRLPLDVEALNQFFLRYKGILKVIREWPHLEKFLLALNLHPELGLEVWKVCLESQFYQGEIYFSGHWHLVLELLKRLIISLRQTPQPKFSFPNFLKAFFKASSVLSRIEILGDGSLSHPHLELLWLSIHQAMLDYGHQPLWINVLPKAVETILVEGFAFNFTKSLEIFSCLRDHPSIFNQLLTFEGSGVELEQFLEDVREISGLASRYHPVLDKLLRGLRIEYDLPQFHEVLSWFLHEKNYPWLDMFLDDPELGFAEARACWQLLQQDSPWTQSYGHLAKPNLPLPCLISDLPQARTSPWWQRLWQAPVLTTPVVEQTPLDSNLLIAREAWDLFKLTPYPRIRQLHAWLSQSPSDLKSELQEFDRFPLGRTEHYAHAQEDFNRWARELTIYSGVTVDLSITQWQLKMMMDLTNRHFSFTRRTLVEKFKEILPKLRQQPQEASMMEFLGILAALYCKSTGRRPYATQLLTILVYLKFLNKNLIFEIDTGEGKGITTALLAVLKWALKEDVVIEIITANSDLVKQDYDIKGHWRFFQLLDIPHRVIDQNSELEDYPRQGIIYTTQVDIAVFKSLHSLQGHMSLPRRIEVIVDEVDHGVLDQNMIINLAVQDKTSLDWSQLYAFINQFVDKNWQEAGVKTWARWAEDLRSAAILHYQGNHFRQSLLTSYSVEQWYQWLEVAVYSKYLVENQDFIVEAIELASGKLMYQALPYIQSEIKFGFELSYKSKSGLKQFLHARLNSPERPFIIEAEPKLLTQIAPNYLAQVDSFVGLTGSFGSVSECRELKESLFANLVRIPRYLPSRLEEAEILVIDNPQLFLQSVLASELHPVLICVPDIEAAKTLYANLYPYFLDRPISLLTGQESHLSRQRWLHQGAGREGAITIATLICGRGTDISVTSPYYLKIFQFGILEPRHTMQLKGRTARNHQPGFYQLVLNRSGFALDSSASRIRALIDTRQREMILAARSQRLLLRMKSWLAKYIFEILATHLRRFQLSFKVQNYLYFYASSALADLCVSEPYNPRSYFEPARQILRTIVAKLALYGPIKLEDQEERLLDSLNADKERWSGIIPQLFSPLSIPQNSQVRGFHLDMHDYVSLIKKIKRQQNKSASFKTWFYRPLPLEELTQRQVEESWQGFHDLVQTETWDAFYSSLISAHILYQELEKNLFLAHSASVLLPWVQMLKLIQAQLEKRKVLAQTESEFFQYLRQTLEKYLEQPKPRTWVVWILKLFQANFYQAYLQVISSLNKCFETPNPSHLKDLQLHLRTFTDAYNEGSHSWWRAWWYRKVCQAFCQAYLDLGQATPVLIQNYAEKAQPYQDWLHLQQSIARYRLHYRQRILKEKHTNLRCFSFWTPSSSLSSELILRAEMDELGRLFSKEIHELYAKFYQLSSQDLSHQPRRWVLLAVLRAYFSPTNPKIAVDLMTEEFKALFAEFDRWSNSRQLLCEWEQMNPNLA